MTDKYLVTVIITTYDRGDNSRFNLLYQTLQALKDNLKYPNLRWIVSDDGSSNHEEMKKNILHLIPETTIYNTERRGVGFAKNNALQKAFEISPFVFLLEDDWLLTEPLDLLSHVQVMCDNPTIGMVRFGFLGGDITATYLDYGPFLTYWKLQPASGFYVYSGQVSLRSIEFYRQIGWHAENCTAGQEEENMCWRYNQTENPPDIIWPAKYPSVINSGPFKNIGLANSVNNVSPESV